MKEILVSAVRCRLGQFAARGAWGLAVVLGLVACAGGEIRREPVPDFHRATTAVRLERELEMNRQWQNKPLAELMEAYGRPKLVLHIPGGGTPPSYAVVYGRDASSGCIDAFAVNMAGDPFVRIYHCR